MALLWIKIDEVQHIYSILYDDDNSIEDGVQRLNIRLSLHAYFGPSSLMNVLFVVGFLRFVAGFLFSRALSAEEIYRHIMARSSMPPKGEYLPLVFIKVTVHLH
jgi:hypothetical protein